MSTINIENYSDFKKSLINEELNNYSSIAQFQDYFDRIAKYILGHVAIVIGDSNSKQIKYYLEEIEFYYNNQQITEVDISFQKDGKDITQKKNFFSCTYKRERDAEKLFWHYSGVDICFQSDKTCYGGILIRSISKCEGDEKNTELIAGPLRCANEIANQSINLKSIPRIEEIKWTTNRILSVDNIGSTVRQGIENADRYKIELERIKNVGAEKISDFPFFCYYIKRGRENWKIRVDDKTVNYNSIPEKRNGIERNIK